MSHKNFFFHISCQSGDSEFAIVFSKISLLLLPFIYMSDLRTDKLFAFVFCQYPRSCMHLSPSSPSLGKHKIPRYVTDGRGFRLYLPVSLGQCNAFSTFAAKIHLTFFSSRYSRDG